MSPTPEQSPPTDMTRRSFLTGTGTVVGAGALASAGVLTACATIAGTPEAAPLVAPSVASVAAFAADAAAIAALGPAGTALTEPVLRKSVNGVLATTLRVAEANVKMGGSTIKTVSYEGTYPGPTLELSPGEILKVALKNDGTDPTNLHTHGFHVSPSDNSDNVLLTVEPKSSFDYEYKLPADHPAGTYWYHSHMHTYSDKEVTAGEFGLIVIRGAFDELPGIKGIPEKIIMVSQTEIKDGAIVDGPDSSLSQQVTIVNGQYQPTIEIAPGEIQRWRILNVNPVFYRFKLDGHDLNLVAVDGNSLTEARKVDVLELGPGGRADVLVQGTTPGTSDFNSLSFESSGPFWTNNMVPVAQTVLRLVTTGTPITSSPLPTTLLPMNDLRTAKIDRKRTFRLEEMEPRHKGPNDAFVYYINGTSFNHDVVNETMKLGTTEEWEFVNLTYEPHPLHIHVNPFQVISINGKPTDENFYRDTAVIPPFATMTIRHQFLDYTGKFVMHCHILFHEDHGMMQLLEVVS